ncbi:ABC transporter ATP-binding protein [Alkalihalobacillus sp. NPDC078783]
MRVLEVKQVHAHYGSKNLFSFGQKQKNVLHNISFGIDEGKCLGLIGTSGSGKSTLGKVILGIHPPSSGHVLFQGKEMYKKGNEKLLRKDLQIVFQDAYSAVNPRMTVEQIIREPMENHRLGSSGDMRKQVIELLERVNLSENELTRFPHELSGGQLQRVTIARALAQKPKLIVLDESVSSLDMITKSLILDLLADLKHEYNLSYLFITHDIKAAFTLSDQIGVMEEGELIELYESKDQFLLSHHPKVSELRKSILAEHPRFRTVAPLPNERTTVKQTFD